MPFFCCNKDDYCDHSENCDGCNVWVRGKGGKEVPSNGDRIRAMTDEELAEYIDAVAEACYNAGSEDLPLSNSNPLSNAYTILEWLQQPAEEGTP